MRFDIHIHDNDLPGDGVAAILQKLSLLLKKAESIMATLDEVLQKVSDQDTALDGVRTLVTGLKQQIADALAGTTLPPAVQAKVDAVFAGLTKNSAEIADALAENVPPDPVIPPVNPI